MKIQINENALLRNLGAVFTDHQKVLSELLQNGRRAGADRVTFTAVDREDDYDLVVHDNGTGLSDFGVLFTLAGSDWNDDIMASEYPYGLGFMACSQPSRLQSKAVRRLYPSMLTRLLAAGISGFRPKLKPGLLRASGSRCTSVKLRARHCQPS